MVEFIKEANFHGKLISISEIVAPNEMKLVESEKKLSDHITFYKKLVDIKVSPAPTIENTFY